MAIEVRSIPSFRPGPVALACGLACLALPALAQDTSDPPAELPAVQVTAPAPASRAQVSGFGDVPLSRAPLQAEVVTEERLKQRGVRKLSDVTALEASVSDSYNAEGYWDYLSIRGFTLDNRYNYRRDGLPINAESIIPLENKSALEILKGTSGIQAGTSAPGGLVNFVVKRPDDRVRSLELGVRSRGTTGFAVDLGDRFGEDDRFGLRVNAAYEDLDPPLRQATGHRRVLAVAGDWRLTPDTLLEAEVETSHRRQPSQPAFSLLGDTLPRPVDPRLNLNNQPWSQPVTHEHHAGSLRLSHRLDADWRVTAHLGTQRVRMNDRLAFPYGCSAEDDYSRYCSDGSYDLYEYISDGERRRTNAAHLYADGRFTTGSLRHAVSFGVLHSRYRFRPQDQVYDYAGTGTVDGRTITPPSERNLSPNTRRDERSTEFYLRDAVTLSPTWSLWAGLRHTRVHRASELTSGDDREATRYRQSATTPWLALSHEFAPGHIAYVSWGRGLESEVVPNRPVYSNRGPS
jgi:iron complex outermembrane receptor protein